MLSPYLLLVVRAVIVCWLTTSMTHRSQKCLWIREKRKTETGSSYSSFTLRKWDERYTINSIRQGKMNAQGIWLVHLVRHITQQCLTLQTGTRTCRTSHKVQVDGARHTIRHRTTLSITDAVRSGKGTELRTTNGDNICWWTSYISQLSAYFSKITPHYSVCIERCVSMAAAYALYPISFL